MALHPRTERLVTHAKILGDNGSALPTGQEKTSGFLAKLRRIRRYGLRHLDAFDLGTLPK